jgi:hypothetical protein
MIIPTSVLSARYQHMKRTNWLLFGQEVSHAYLITLFCLTLYSILPRTDQEQHQLGEEYHQLPTPTTCKNFVKDHAT